MKYCGGMLELKKIAAFCEAARGAGSAAWSTSPVGNVSARTCVRPCRTSRYSNSLTEKYLATELIDPPEALDKGNIVLSLASGPGDYAERKTIAKYKYEWPPYAILKACASA